MFCPRRWGRWKRCRRRSKRSPSGRNTRAGSVSNDFTSRAVVVDVTSLHSNFLEHPIPFCVPGWCTVAAKASLRPTRPQLTEDRGAAFRRDNVRGAKCRSN